jgi:hypothetical protein
MVLWLCFLGAGSAHCQASYRSIDAMAVASGYVWVHQPGEPFTVGGIAQTYFMSDGSTYASGAGASRPIRATFERVERSGSVLRYFFLLPPDGIIFSQRDSGVAYASNGTLALEGDLVLEATEGSTTAVMRGAAKVVMNEPPDDPAPHFVYYGAPIGAVVPFELTYTFAYNGQWTERTFEEVFTYGCVGRIDLAHPMNTPSLHPFFWNAGLSVERIEIRIIA